MIAAVAPSLPLYRLDVETYNRIVASGALEGEKLELLEGLLVERCPHTPSHAAAIMRLTRHLAAGQLRLRVQLPLEIPPDSEPEPDLAALAEEPPPGQHPRTALFVIEVAVSSHFVDRGVKERLYAQIGVPTYWLVDVPGRAIEVRSDPGPEGYRRCEIYGVGATVQSPVEGWADLDVGELFEGLGG